ncbi:MAG: ABC transporter permease [Bacteroidota bacterium]
MPAITLRSDSSKRYVTKALGRIGRSSTGMVVPLLVLGLWYSMLELGIFQPYQLPYPQDVLMTLAEMWRAGELQGHILITVQRVAVGFAFGASAGVAFGVLTGLNHLADRFRGGHFAGRTPFAHNLFDHVEPAYTYQDLSRRPGSAERYRPHDS